VVSSESRPIQAWLSPAESVLKHSIIAEAGANSMSDSHGHEPAASHDELFDKSELAGFVADDQLAGRQICKMLSALFVYTLIAMSTAATWTYLATH